LPLFVDWLSLRLSGCDFRGPAFVCALALGGLALGLTRVAGRLRGQTRYADAFLPVTLFSTAWADSNFYFTNGVFYSLPSIIAGVVLLVAAEKGMRLSLRALLLAGSCLLLLPLCGAPGLLYVPAFFSWLWVATLLGLRAQAWRQRYIRLGVLAGISAVLLLTGLYYFRGFESTGRMHAHPTLWTLVQGASAFMTATGPPGYRRFFYSQQVVVTLLLLSVAALLITICKKDGPARSRAWGLLFFLAGYGCLMLALSWGRQGDTSAYALLAVPLPCWLYLVWCVYRPNTIGYLVQTCLFVWILLPLQSGMEAILPYLEDRRARVDAFLADVKGGLPPYMLLPRHKDALCPSWGDHGILADAMSLLHEARIGSFQAMRENPPFEEVAFPLDRLGGNEMTWKNGTGHGTGPESYVTIPLKDPTLVAGVRIVSRDAGSFASVSWRKSGEDFPTTPQFGGQQFGTWLIIFIGETIDEIRIQPAFPPGPFDIEISDITLFIPPAGK
jgi:hypothetical protein